MAADTNCHDCQEGPKGIAGHAGLAMDDKVKPGKLPVFWCSRCGQRFNRTYEGSGVFIWTPLAADATSE